MEENISLAALYTVYNGLELLRPSIRSIYDQVDVIVICWQEVSNTGHKSTEVVEYIEEMYSEFDDKIRFVRFAPDLGLSTKENEMAKHQHMIDYARSIKCSHFLMMATDHFYLPAEFAHWKQKAFEYDVTITGMYTYYKNPEWQLTPPENYYMPFIHRLYPHTQITTGDYPVLVDPAVKVNTTERVYLFHESEIMLHHYSMIRTDIENKFKNAAASINWTPQDVERFVDEYVNYDININAGISYFNGRRIKQVPNYFNI